MSKVILDKTNPEKVKKKPWEGNGLHADEQNRERKKTFPSMLCKWLDENKGSQAASGTCPQAGKAHAAQWNNGGDSDRVHWIPVKFAWKLSSAMKETTKFESSPHLPFYQLRPVEVDHLQRFVAFESIVHVLGSKLRLGYSVREYTSRVFRHTLKSRLHFCHCW